MMPQDFSQKAQILLSETSVARAWEKYIPDLKFKGSL